MTRVYNTKNGKWYDAEITKALEMAKQGIVDYCSFFRKSKFDGIGDLKEGLKDFNDMLNMIGFASYTAETWISDIHSAFKMQIKHFEGLNIPVEKTVESMTQVVELLSYLLRYSDMIFSVLNTTSNIDDYLYELENGGVPKNVPYLQKKENGGGDE